jgi:hypothetical protein
MPGALLLKTTDFQDLISFNDIQTSFHGLMLQKLKLKFTHFVKLFGFGKVFWKWNSFLLAIVVAFLVRVF